MPTNNEIRQSLGLKPVVGLDQRVALQEEPKQTFGEKASSIMTGEREVFDGTGGGWLRRGARAVGNVVAGLFREPARIISSTAMQAADALPGGGPTLGQFQEQYALSQRVMAEMDDRLADRINKLDPDRPDDRKMLDHITNFMATRGSIDEPFVPKELDVSGLRQGLGYAETAALIVMLKTPGVNALHPFNKSYKTVMRKIVGHYGTLEAKELAVVGLGYAVENAAYAALATYTKSRPPGEKATLKEVMTNAGLGAAVGGPLGLALGVAAPRLIGGGMTGLFETFRDMADMSSARGIRGVDAPTGYSRATTINTKGVKPKAIVESPRPGDVAADDFGTVFVGDIVSTKEGVVGRVTGSLSKPAATELVDPLQSLLKKVAQNEQAIATARRDGAKPALIKALEESRKDLGARVDATLQKIGETGETGFDKRVESVQIEVMDSNGRPQLVYIPKDSLLDGGIIRGREVLVPTRDASLGAKATANEIAHAQLSQRRAGINISDQNMPLPALTGISDEDLFSALESRGHTAFTRDFEPKRATALNLLTSEADTLRASGINPRVGQLAEANMERDQSNMFTALRALMKDAFEENGIVFPEGFINTLKVTAGGSKRTKQVEELSERLFRAAEGERPLSELKPKERALVLKWQDISRDLLERVNLVLVASGKKPIKGVEKYITNILTPQAMAIHKLTGSIPPGLLSELMGGKAAALFKGKTARQIIDTLLLPRHGGLPIERDFFKAINKAVTTHTKFIHMQPVLREYNLVIKHLNQLLDTKFHTNRAIIQNFLNKLAGKDVTHEFLRSIDQTVIETLSADKWLGVKNPFQKWFTEDIDTAAFGRVRVPTSGLISKVGMFGVNKGILSPKAIKHRFYVTQLAFNSTYPILNLTQYPLLAVPRLRGPALQRYKTAFNSWRKVVGKMHDPAFIEEMRVAGVLNDVQRFTEFEAGTTTSMLGVRGGAWEKVSMWTSKTSEFINRSSTFEAVYDNILTTTKFDSGGKAYNQYWDEVNKLSKGEVYKKARELAEEMSSIVNFKSGITHRAPISDNPVGALWDQFNSYFRGFVGSHKAMYRNMKENDPEFVQLWKNMFEKGDVSQFFAGFLKRMKDENITATKKGELYRFYANGTLFLIPLSLAGLSAGKGAKDFFFGGLSRFSDGIMDMVDGVIYGDDEKINRGMASIAIPPSIPPMLTMAKDAYQWTFGGETFTVKKLVLAPYSPVKKVGTETIPALKALVVGTAQPVTDPKTGRIKYVIEPEDAVNKILFGYRSKTDEERNSELDLMSKLKAQGTRKTKEKQRIANDIIDELDSRDPAGRRKYWEGLVMEGTIDLDDTEMAGIIVDEWYHRKLLQSGTIERTLKTLPAEEKAEYLEKVTASLDREEKNAIFARQYAEGNLGSEVVKELVAGKVKPKEEKKSGLGATIAAGAAAAAALLLTRGRGAGKVAAEVAEKVRVGSKDMPGPGAVSRKFTLPGAPIVGVDDAFVKDVRNAASKGALQASGDVPVDVKLPPKLESTVKQIVKSAKVKVIRLNGSDADTAQKFTDHVMNAALEGTPPLNPSEYKDVEDELLAILIEHIIPSRKGRDGRGMSILPEKQGAYSMDDVTKTWESDGNKAEGSVPEDLVITYDKVVNVLRDLYEFLFKGKGADIENLGNEWDSKISVTAGKIMREWKD